MKMVPSPGLVVIVTRARANAVHAVDMHERHRIQLIMNAPM